MAPKSTAPTQAESPVSILKLASLRVAKEKETDGSWQTAPTLPGVEFLVRSTNYPAFKVAITQANKRLMRIHKNDIPDEIALVAEGRAYADHLLLDWKGLDVPYDQGTALKYLTDPEYKPLIDAVRQAALMAGIPEFEFIEDATKNSETPSVTT